MLIVVLPRAMDAGVNPAAIGLGIRNSTSFMHTGLTAPTQKDREGKHGTRSYSSARGKQVEAAL